MREVFGLIESYIRGMLRYRWHALAFAWFAFAAGAIWVYSIPDVYRVSSRVYVDTESMLKRLLERMVVSSDTISEVNVMTKALLSRPHLEEVARETDLILRARTPREREQLIENLRMRVFVSQGIDQLFTIGYDDPDPQMAENVVRSLLNSLMEDSLGTTRTDTTRAQQFLDEEISKYERRLSEAEQRLADFKKEHVGLMPGSEGDYYSRLNAEMQTLAPLEKQIREVETRRAELLRQLEGEEPVFGLVSPVDRVETPSSYDAQISETEARLAQLRLEYTDKHPDIAYLLTVLEELRRKRAAEVAQRPTMQASRGYNELDLNPVYQQLRVQLSNSEVELVTLRRQLRDQQAKVEELREKIDTIPDIEAQLSRLNRDYGVAKAQYEDLLRRRELADLSYSAEATRDEVQFRIIEPPLAPSLPEGPNRLMLLVGVLLGAVAGGGGLAFMLHQIHPVFASRDELKTETGVTVLGTISRFMTEPGRKQHTARVILYGSAVTLLGVLFIAAIVFSTEGSYLTRSFVEGLSR